MKKSERNRQLFLSQKTELNRRYMLLFWSGFAKEVSQGFAKFKL